jgi:hypothetical protein
MTKTQRASILALIALSLSTPIAPLAPLFAHHSIAAEYGGGKGPTRPLEGKVTKVRWSNPHIEIYIDSSGTNGLAAGEWVVNSHAPGLLARTYGIRPGEIKVGDSVKVVGWESQQGVPRFHMRAISINDGQMRSTHRSSDIKELKEGTMGSIVPAPGTSADSKDQYGSNLGAGAKGDQEQATNAKAADSGSSLPWIWLVGFLVLGGLGAFLLRKRGKSE